MNMHLPRNLCMALVGLSASSMIACDVMGAVITVSAVKDAMIFARPTGEDTGMASGKGPGMFAGADSSLNKKRAMIEFDLSLIPTDATITDVTMTLHLGQVAGSGGSGTGTMNYSPRVLTLYTLLQDWGEGNSGWPTSPSIGGTGQGFTRVNGDSTWDYAYYNSDPSQAVKWGEPGSPVKGGYVSDVSSGDVSFTGPYSSAGYPAYTFSTSGMVADVQSWVSGSLENNGWMIRANVLETSSQSFLGFWTKEGAAAYLSQFGGESLAPSLTITYSVPEPASMITILLAVPTLLRRRSCV